MELGESLGFAGLVVAFVALGITIMWPTKRWIGYVSFVFAAVLVCGWALMEYQARHREGDLPQVQAIPPAAPSQKLKEPRAVEMPRAIPKPHSQTLKTENSEGINTAQSSSGSNSPNVNAPYGIAIGGGTVVNPTVNNFAPPARHFESGEARTIISNCLRAKPGAVLVYAFQGSTESADFAAEWLNLLQNSGWKLEDPNVHSFMEGGAAWSGTKIEIKGTYRPDDAPHYDTTTPGGAFAECIQGKAAADKTQIELKEDLPPERMNILIGPR